MWNRGVELICVCRRKRIEIRVSIRHYMGYWLGVGRGDITLLSGHPNGRGRNKLSYVTSYSHIRSTK